MEAAQSLRNRLSVKHFLSRSPDAFADVREAAARVPGHRLRQGRNAPVRYGETGDEVVVEYDEDVLRSLKELDDFT